MTPIANTFEVLPAGIGRVDYSLAVERSTSNIWTAPLRQENYVSGSDAVVPPLPWPWAYIGVMPMPQEDGSFDYPASTITVHFVELHLCVESNILLSIFIMRYNSLADYFIYNIAEYTPRIYGYNEVNIHYNLGYATRPGCVYGAGYMLYSPHPTEHLLGRVSGIMTDLTRPWMT